MIAGIKTINPGRFRNFYAFKHRRNVAGAPLLGPP